MEKLAEQQAGDRPTVPTSSLQSFSPADSTLPHRILGIFMVRRPSNRSIPRPPALIDAASSTANPFFQLFFMNPSPSRLRSVFAWCLIKSSFISRYVVFSDRLLSVFVLQHPSCQNIKHPPGRKRQDRDQRAAQHKQVQPGVPPALRSWTICRQL